MLATLLILGGAFVASASFEVKLQSNEDDVGEAGDAFRLLNERFPSGSDPTEQLLLAHPDIDVDDPAFQVLASSLMATLLALPQVASVSNYYETENPTLVSEDRRVLRAEIQVDPSFHNGEPWADGILEAVGEARQAASDDGYTVAVAGPLTTNREVNQMVEEDFGKIIFISLGIGLVILLLAFRALVAAVVPLLLALGAIMIANGMAAVVSQWYSLNESYSEMILLLGLAVGIDYSLFIVSRFRTERASGLEKMDAIRVACNTTGRAVFYAGLTVLQSLAGLMLTNHPIFISLALGAMLVVFVTIIGAMTFLPAALNILGDRVNSLPIPILSRVRGGGIWGAITDRVMARPAIYATVSLAALIAISIPAASLNLGFPTGSKAFNDAVTGKQAIKLLEEHFTGGLTDPLFVVVTADDVSAPAVQSAVGELLAGMEADPEAFFGPFETVVSEDLTALFILAPVSGEIDVAEGSVNALRDDIIPAAFANTGAVALVTGFAALNKDFRDYMYSKAPYVFGFVLGLAFLLLLVMFRSLVIPIKSIILNLLSVGAAYGVLVMVFQWGWGVSLFGSEATRVTLAWLPLFLFAILFGLSMDYHMLLLNRVKESWDKTGDNDLSVAMGVRLTAGQITSAAAIMVGVFSAFALSREVGLQQFGVGLGVSVLIDATVIRSVLLPATMKLLGDWNWYLPGWLEWLPKVFVAEPEPAA
jgi:uncharacterized membrane protein YdfJ with MMPL/SSD domain